MALETTLVLFKPDVLEKNLTGKVLLRFKDAGFVIRGIKMMRLDEKILREHYSHLTEMPFFPRIIAFMTRTPVIALVLEAEDAIARGRALLGPTDSKVAPKGTLRGDYGEDTMINIGHASDSTEAAAVEIKRFFKDEEVFSF